MKTNDQPNLSFVAKLCVIDKHFGLGETVNTLKSAGPSGVALFHLIKNC